ncbi:phage tail protein [Vibrio crassostreae]|uniref:phage tail-collar fiber domain-containing protein n=1 Tax=Vibrio crassostreae TaxID=246167 RepID=UPI0010460860|nr:tail-collar fiber protein [Vibrio crassostreae]
MSQTAIPLEFEQYLQNKISLGEPTDLNEIIFAMIPNLDLSKPIDRTVGLPPLEQWVYQQDVDQIGKSGVNSVVYSVVIQGSEEPFTFNAMFLRDKNVPDSCGMVVYKATETKEVSMALTKSMLMQFDGAASAANVTVDAATWQIDYQARLSGMDEEHRLACLDNYGHTAFVDGFDVTRHDVDQNKYLVAPGVVYVGGLRIQNALVVAHNVTQKPTTLWLDVHRDGTALSTHENQFKVVASTSDLVNYVDGDGLQHYVCKLAGVEADGSVVDLRVKGKLDDFLMVDDFVGLVIPDSTVIPMRHKAFLGDGSDYAVEDYPKLMSKVQGTAIIIDQALIDAEPEKYAANYGISADGLRFTVPNYSLRPHLAAAGAFGAVGSTKEDHIQNITGHITPVIGQSNGQYLGVSNTRGGAFANLIYGNAPVLNKLSDEQNVALGMDFNASRVARTSSYTEVNSSFLNFYIIHGESA